jgi:hypothetical protein
MKRHNVLIIAVVAIVMGAIAHAQQRTLSPEAQEDLIKAQRLQELSNQARLAVAQQGLQRGGGARGTYALTGPAWWTNAALVAQLGLTDDQKTKIERAFENHRQDLTSKTESLQKEEAQLARLLETEPLDRNAVFAEIDRVIQARGDLERTNSAMTLEMREALTIAQWMQLPRTALTVTRTPFGAVVTPGGAGGRGQRQGPGQRQQ